MRAARGGGLASEGDLVRTTFAAGFLDCKLHVGGLARHTRWEQCLQQVVSDWELHLGGASK